MKHGYFLFRPNVRNMWCMIVHPVNQPVYSNSAPCGHDCKKNLFYILVFGKLIHSWFMNGDWDIFSVNRLVLISCPLDCHEFSLTKLHWKPWSFTMGRILNVSTRDVYYFGAHYTALNMRPGNAFSCTVCRLSKRNQLLWRLNTDRHKLPDYRHTDIFFRFNL